MRQLSAQFIEAAQKIIKKDKAETLQYVLTDLNNYRSNYPTANESAREQIKAGFARHNLDVETVTDNQISELAHELTENKWSQIINKFEDYPIEKIFTMAQSNQNKLSHAFIELEYSVKLPKTQRDRRPFLSDLWSERHESPSNPNPLKIEIEPPAPKVYKTYNLYGFEALIGSLRAGRLEAMLDDTRRKISYNGQAMSRREYIESMAKNPKTEKFLSHEHIKWANDNLYSSRLNKSCGEYFEYLKSIWFKDELPEINEAEEAHLFGGLK